jgi:hypothetical protein
VAITCCISGARRCQARGTLLSVAANDERDLVVALAVLGDGNPGVAEPALRIVTPCRAEIMLPSEPPH